MQGSTVNFAQAASGAGRAWLPPRLYADWFGDGYSELPTSSLASLVVVDDFDRSVIDAYGHNRNGRQWTNTGGTAANYYVQGGYAYQAHAANQVDHFSHIELGDTNFDVTAFFALPALPTGAAVLPRLRARWQDATNLYEAVVTVAAGGAVTFGVSRLATAGNATVASGVAVGTYVAGHIWGIRFQGRSTALRARAWDASAMDQPYTWDIDTTDSSAVAGTRVGFASYLDSGNSNTKPYAVAWSDFRAVSPGIDDLTPLAGGWQVQHHLDDGLPDEVAFISGIGVGQLDADLSAPPAYLTDGQPMRPAQYFSPYNVDSPLYGLDRDVAPVKLDHGLVTSAGKERVRVFTGRMENLPVSGGQTKLIAISDTRVKLMRAVQPPAVYGAYQGANATWAMSYALHVCGVYPSPPPQDGCRWWAPMHGSFHSFLPADNKPHLDTLVFVDGIAGPSRRLPIEWVDGPYVAGFAGSGLPLVQNVGANTGTNDGIWLEPGAPLITQTGKGKLEFWVRGDASNATNYLIRFRMYASTGQFVEAGVAATTYKPFIRFMDGVNDDTFSYSIGVPLDGEWHFVGLSWDIAAEDRWLNLDGVVETSLTATTTPGNFPTTEVWATRKPDIQVGWPVSEIQLTAGVTPATHVGWLNALEGVTWTRGAYLMKSDLELASIAERAPREAWELLGSYALSELASLRADENDLIQYRTLGYWVQDAQQVATALLSTDVNMEIPDITIDPSKLRNSITVTYDEGRNQDAYAAVFAGQDVIALPPGVTVLVLPLSPAAAEIRGFSFINIADADTTQPSSQHFISANDVADGTGNYATTTEISAAILEWDPGQATVQVTNATATTYYTANDKTWASINVAAKELLTSSASVTESDPNSVAIRSERNLPVTRSDIQSRVDARRLARNLLMALRKPVPVIEAVKVLGDPRRQPGDLATFQDPTVTRVSGTWRVHTVTHDWDGGRAKYTQDITVRPTLPILVVGQGKIGQTLIGPEE